MEDTGLSVRHTDVGIFIPPEIVLENARTAARALADVISTKKKPVIMNGEQYLEFEDWQTLGQFYGYAVKTGEAVAVEIDGVKGAKAQANVIDIKTGMYLGGAEAYCMRDEEKWNTRPKYEWQGKGNDSRRVKIGDEVVPWFQLASMAQTRAGAKALRNRLAWVAVLAGYRPTPAEEMTEGTVSEAVKERRTVDKSQHYCQSHNVNFFKKGRMKGYAHPIDGTDQWCNEAVEGEVVVDTAKAEKDAKDLWPTDKASSENVDKALAKRKAQEQPPEATQEQIEAVEQETGAEAPFTTEDLLNKVCEKKGMQTHKQARGYLIGTCKVTASKIDKEPQAVWDEYGTML